MLIIHDLIIHEHIQVLRSLLAAEIRNFVVTRDLLLCRWLLKPGGRRGRSVGLFFRSRL